ncbi:MAG: hypothetical protein ACR2RV_28175, partial [Verrucomicrobiales bacterium]
MSDCNSFPTARWHDDMRQAIDQICDVGARLFEHHRSAGPKAEAAAIRWKLGERLGDERAALDCILGNMGEIIRGTEHLEELLASPGDRGVGEWEPHVIGLSRLLHRALPEISSAFSDVRHCALDLLRWTTRSGHIEGSEWPDRYRQSYARLISYAPDFDRLWEALDADVEALNQRTAGSPALRELITALAVHRQLKGRMRGFLRSVIDPPFELIFHETDTFIADWERLSPDSQAMLATEFNDCCQLLLYNQPGFDAQVDAIALPLVDGLEASLLMLPVADDRILFLADED